jgi:two-component system, chemotaxis family, protein-glutamate methylesterase/glutaminase
MKKINVMIVDDSALVRQTLLGILNSDPDIEVIATAADPIFAAQKITRMHPDVITLDLEMPRMNGLTFLKKLMATFPVPVVVISGLTSNSADLTFKALEYGAVEVIAKPRMATKEFFEESGIVICDAVKAAARVNMHKCHKINTVIPPKYSADSILVLPPNPVHIKDTADKIIVIGASTGGTHAILAFLEKMPRDCPGIVIVQHMPEVFTRSFADRLNSLCTIEVKEGEQGDQIIPGRAIIAPGNKHMMINKSLSKYIIEINEGPLVNRHRPSVDVLFRSAAKYAGQNAMGIILTGMGEDGAKGLLEMNRTGSYTIAQDEASCVVFGMPKSAINLNAVNTVLPMDKIAGHVCQKLSIQ